jgi:ligand-binding SRPBCC domain-containing protein
MALFTRSTLVPAPPMELFRFHENPHNLRAISPPNLRILEIRAGEQAQPGEEFAVAVQQGPLTLRWTGRWETVAAPGLLIDTGLKCPFALWRHHHIFEPHSEGSVLTDRVEFRLPWFLGGPLADQVLRHLVFPRLFAARHAATRHHFEAAR